MKRFRNLIRRVNGDHNRVRVEQNDGQTYKYSVYMQSRDSNWLRRNVQTDDTSDVED
jgi:hypothetical protein